MARRTDSGKYIISAGEVGAYTVCPESWRLKYVERIKTQKTERAIKGSNLHKEWAAQVDQSFHLSQLTNIAISLLVLMCIAAWCLL